MDLIDRQLEVMRYLQAAPQGDGVDGSDGPAVPQGIDPRGLSLLGRLSRNKRQDKVRAILPRTYAVVREQDQYDFVAFSGQYPQGDPTYLENAKQYVAFLREVWRERAPDPAWLPDLVRYEIEHAVVQAGARASMSGAAPKFLRTCVRRHPSLRLSRYAHDIRGIVEGDNESEYVVPARDLRLAMAVEEQSQRVRVFELKPDVYDVLDKVSTWHTLESLRLGDAMSKRPLVERLRSLGLVEVSE